MRQQFTGDSVVTRANTDLMAKRIFLLLDAAVDAAEGDRFGPDVAQSAKILDLARAYREIKG